MGGVRTATASYKGRRLPLEVIKFGQAYANGLRRRRPGPGDKWHPDEVFVKINGVTHYLWCAVDQAGNSHQPARLHERAMKRFKSARDAERLPSSFSGISPHFRPRRNRSGATEWLAEMAHRFAAWHEVTVPHAAA